MNLDRAAAIGFAISPIAPAVIGAALTRLGPNFNFFAFSGLALIFYFFYAAVTIGFGLPAFLFASRYNLVRWWSTTGTGYLGGTIMALVLRLPNRPQTADFWILATDGAFIGFVFWVVWKIGKLYGGSKNNLL